MTVVHNHPHPLAHQVVDPTNPAILAKFGRVRVEDWDDRVAGLTWAEQLHQGNYQQANIYSEDQYLQQLSGGLSAASPRFDVVRCHTLTTGELVLLHNDWLPVPDQQ